MPSEFHDLAEVFSPGLGKFKGKKIHIELREDAHQPVFHNARNVPFTLREKVEKALDQLEASKVIEKVTVSEWATPIVAVEKGEGVRIGADYSATVNPQLKIPLPTRWFCCLNMSSQGQNLLILTWLTPIYNLSWTKRRLAS